MEGEVNLILPLRHRPVCSDSKMSNEAFQNPHLFGWKQGIRAVCISKEMLRKAFFVAAPIHLTMCVSQTLCLCLIPTLSQYPQIRISFIIISQNGTQPICLTVAESSTLSRLDMVLACTDDFLSLSLHITNAPSSAKQHRAEGLKGRRHQNESEKSISSRRAVK